MIREFTNFSKGGIEIKADTTKENPNDYLTDKDYSKGLRALFVDTKTQSLADVIEATRGNVGGVVNGQIVVVFQPM